MLTCRKKLALAIRFMLDDEAGRPTPRSAYTSRLLLWGANLLGASFLPFITHLFSQERFNWLGPDLIAICEAVVFFSFVDVIVAASWRNGLHRKLTNPLAWFLIVALALCLIASGIGTYVLAASKEKVLGPTGWLWCCFLIVLSVVAEAFVAMLEHDVDEKAPSSGSHLNTPVKANERRLRPTGWLWYVALVFLGLVAYASYPRYDGKDANEHRN